MEAEVIAIGDELTSGQRLDTNSKWLSQELSNLGIRTVRHTTIGDDLAHNVDALRQAAQRVDIVVCTGGLGPTLDDLTRQAFADAFDAPLELDEDSLEHIRQLFVSRGRDMPERNRAQALFPRGSQTIPNPHGSAPGIDFTSAKDSCRFFALPGVPAEMTEMWFHTVVPRIESMAANPLGPLRFHAVKVFGIGESDVEVRLPELISRDRIPTVGITVSRATITLLWAAWFSVKAMTNSNTLFTDYSVKRGRAWPVLRSGPRAWSATGFFNCLRTLKPKIRAKESVVS